MPTNSFLKDIEVKDKKQGVAFVDALEIAFSKAESTTDKNSDTSHCTELTGADITKFFTLWA